MIPVFGVHLWWFGGLFTINYVRPSVLDLETWLNKRDSDNVCNLQRWYNRCHKNGALWYSI